MKYSEKFVAYILFCLSCLTINFNVAAITAAIPLISVDLRLADFEVSRIIPYYMMPYGIGALICAPLTRFVSYRKVMAGSMFLFAVASFICSSVRSIEYFLVARVVMGVAAAGTIPLGLMIIGEFFDKKARGRLVGTFFGCAFVASLAGVAIGGLAAWRWLFLIPGVLAALLTGGFLLLASPYLGRVHNGHINYLRAFRNRSIRHVFVVIFAISFLYHGVHTWYGIYLSRVYGFDQLSISLCLIAAAFGGLLGQVVGGVLTDTKGRLFTCLAGMMGLAFSTMALVHKYPVFILVCILVMIALCWTLGHNGVSTVLTDFSSQDRPMIAGLNSAVRFSSGALGFHVSSYCVQKSFSMTFFVIGFFMLLLTLSLPGIIPKTNKA